MHATNRFTEFSSFLVVLHKKTENKRITQGLSADQFAVL